MAVQKQGCRKGPGQHWRSKEHQTVERAGALKKECSRRVAIHEVLDEAVQRDSLDAKVDELNRMMLDHFQLSSTEQVMYKHMAWLAHELSKGRVSSQGLDFAQRVQAAGIDP